MVIKRRLFGEQVFHIPHMHDSNDCVLRLFSIAPQASKALPKWCLFCISGYIIFEGVVPLFIPLQIEITHRVAWRASAGGLHCDQTTISSQNLLYSGNLVCQSGCSGRVGIMSFYCTDFSTSGDWTTGGRTYIYNATGITYFEAS